MGRHVLRLDEAIVGEEGLVFFRVFCIFAQCL